MPCAADRKSRGIFHSQFNDFSLMGKSERQISLKSQIFIGINAYNIFSNSAPFPSVKIRKLYSLVSVQYNRKDKV